MLHQLTRPARLCTSLTLVVEDSRAQRVGQLWVRVHLDAPDLRVLALLGVVEDGRGQRVGQLEVLVHLVAPDLGVLVLLGPSRPLVLVVLGRARRSPHRSPWFPTLTYAWHSVGWGACPRPRAGFFGTGFWEVWAAMRRRVSMFLSYVHMKFVYVYTFISRYISISGCHIRSVLTYLKTSMTNNIRQTDSWQKALQPVNASKL